ncbi:hypothetical protein DFA_04542 [Cavenderia fasciculata]|uniref:Fe2OG dioxygenase domain-containing protein n=1 Tax=Cavenderia fasciculata TaxID=261658 RepID=F4PPV8_CACFS|nr:uncharacterized protein DFA_04542 [Cavenderia fasciculata]EGG22421.1 hypothetical protein DFA_04542 [Cavenderia fasciculata]|eukprot:XP_004360272.1 hypothetical protein DFA_04542 [Cavenderia fasciculata]
MLPIIDIGSLDPTLNDKEGWLRVAKEIDQACRTNHFITEKRFKEFMNATKQFFELSTEEKMKIYIGNSKNHKGYVEMQSEHLDPTKKVDYKEALDMGLNYKMADPNNPTNTLNGPNQYPQSLGQEWVDVIESYAKDVLEKVAKRLMQTMAYNLGAPLDYFDKLFNERNVSTLRIIHYPPRLAEENEDEIAKLDPSEQYEKMDTVGCGTHTDYGCITLLYQDEIGGLQVRNTDGNWIEATPIPNTFVVNIGDMMMRWSNDLYKSTPHRVISHGNKDRYSSPYFFEPYGDAIVACLPSCHSDSNPIKYPPITCNDYLSMKFDQTHGYRQHQIDLEKLNNNNNQPEQLKQ